MGGGFEGCVEGGSREVERTIREKGRLMGV